MFEFFQFLGCYLKIVTQIVCNLELTGQYPLD